MNWAARRSKYISVAPELAWSNFQPHLPSSLVQTQALCVRNTDAATQLLFCPVPMDGCSALNQLMNERRNESHPKEWFAEVACPKWLSYFLLLFFWLLCNCAVFCLKWSSHEAKIEKKVSGRSWRKKLVRFCVAFVFFRAKGFSGIGVVGHEVKHSSTRVVRMTFDEFAQLVVIMPSCHSFQCLTFWPSHISKNQF